MRTVRTRKEVAQAIDDAAFAILNGTKRLKAYELYGISGSLQRKVKERIAFIEEQRRTPVEADYDTGEREREIESRKVDLMGANTIELIRMEYGKEPEVPNCFEVTVCLHKALLKHNSPFVSKEAIKRVWIDRGNKPEAFEKSFETAQGKFAKEVSYGLE